MNGSYFKFILAALAVWRVSHLFSREDGPWNILSHIRRLGGTLFNCFYCLSVWAAIPAALCFRASWQDFILLWLGISGAACLLDRVTDRLTPEPVVIEHLAAAAVSNLPAEGKES